MLTTRSVAGSLCQHTDELQALMYLPRDSVGYMHVDGEHVSTLYARTTRLQQDNRQSSTCTDRNEALSLHTYWQRICVWTMVVTAIASTLRAQQVQPVALLVATLLTKDKPCGTTS